MRYVLLAVIPALGLVACVKPPDSGGGGSGYYPPPDPGPGGPGGSYGCTSDSECGANNVCARTAECLPASAVYAVHVLWTINGQQASAASCASVSGLEVDFSSNDGGSWGYAPVPCMEGKFTVDKMPTSFNFADVSRQDDANVAAGGAIDRATGNVTVDLTL
jgi:hypothetical protein